MTVTSTVPAPRRGRGRDGGRAVDGEGRGRVAVPKSTAVAPVKLVPVIVTVVPPVLGPEVGLTPVTVGGRRRGVGVLVGGAGGARAPGGGHGDVDGAGVPAGPWP